MRIVHVLCAGNLVRSWEYRVNKAGQPLPLRPCVGSRETDSMRDKHGGTDFRGEARGDSEVGV